MTTTNSGEWEGFQVILPVSSTVQKMGYNPVAKKLRIQFKYGTYTYEEVPPELWEDLQSADSAGSFIHYFVKNKFTHTKD